ncbi:MAG: ribose 5-phosphate isomerase B [Deltaproteobacteria bacterium]|nr:ribose 5-phosphate isomerase B [Deltaproteobacteria bacterium]
MIEKDNTIALGSDHAGPELKAKIIEHLNNQGYKTLDLGCPVGTERVDYPDIASKVVATILEGQAHFGILICGTGIGMSLAANRVPGIRAANCNWELTARLARAHNNANILTIGARILGETLALSIVDSFFATSFEGGRHAERLALF